MEITQLTPKRKRELVRAGIIEPDFTLLRQCAYYPRKGAFGKGSPCLECTFDSPNDKCPRGDILINTRLQPGEKRHEEKTELHLFHYIAPEEEEKRERLRRVKINSEKNCSHCLFYRGVMKAGDGSIISGYCSALGLKDISIYRGIDCITFTEDNENPVPRKPRKDPIIDPLRKQALEVEKRDKKTKNTVKILSNNEKVKELLDRLFNLPKRSSAEGKKIRKKLRAIGYYLSREKE